MDYGNISASFSIQDVIDRIEEKYREILEAKHIKSMKELTKFGSEDEIKEWIDMLDNGRDAEKVKRLKSVKKKFCKEYKKIEDEYDTTRWYLAAHFMNKMKKDGAKEVIMSYRDYSELYSSV